MTRLFEEKRLKKNKNKKKHNDERLQRAQEAAFGHSYRPSGFFGAELSLDTENLSFKLFFFFFCFNNHRDMLAAWDRYTCRFK